MVHAKSDAEVIAVRPILDLPNVTLVLNAEVIRLETDPSGRQVTGVLVDRGGDGKEEVYSGDIVVIAAGAANSAKILLRSASDAHPAGLANGSDQPASSRPGDSPGSGARARLADGPVRASARATTRRPRPVPGHDQGSH